MRGLILIGLLLSNIELNLYNKYRLSEMLLSRSPSIINQEIASLRNARKDGSQALSLPDQQHFPVLNKVTGLQSADIQSA